MNDDHIMTYYAHDHDELHKFFEEYQRNKRTNYPLAKEYFKKFKFGLQRHILWEDEIVFPLFEQKTETSRDNGPTAMMRYEHRQIETALEAVHKKVQRGDPNSDAEDLKLMGLLHEHNEKEEHVIYPITDKLTSTEERKEVFHKMEAVPPEKYKTCCQVKV